MSKLTQIKEDEFGLYVVAGGWIARPFFGTCFQEGDRVKAHHFGGSTNAGVTIEEFNFKSNSIYEIWVTTGIMASEYNKISKTKIKENTEWYKNHVRGMEVIYGPFNNNAAIKIKKKTQHDENIHD